MTEDIIAQTFRLLRDSINCQLPCKITAVNDNGTVDVLVFRNDGIENCVFPNVPIRHLETSRAYVFLGVSVGDRGVIRYFDRSVEAYKKGNEDDTSDIRQHSLSDGLFELGFIPQTEAYVYPTDKSIEIGNKNGSFKLSIAPDGEMTLTTTKDLSVSCLNANVVASASVVVESPSVDLGSVGGQQVALNGDPVMAGGVVIGTIQASSTKVRAL